MPAASRRQSSRCSASAPGIPAGSGALDIGSPLILFQAGVAPAGLGSMRRVLPLVVLGMKWGGVAGAAGFARCIGNRDSGMRVQSKARAAAVNGYGRILPNSCVDISAGSSGICRP